MCFKSEVETWEEKEKTQIKILGKKTTLYKLKSILNEISAERD